MTEAEIQAKNYVRLSQDITFIFSLAEDGYHKCVGWSEGAERTFGWTAYEMFMTPDPLSLLFGVDAATVETERVRQYSLDGSSRLGEPQTKTMITREGKLVRVLICGSMCTCEGPTGLGMIATAVIQP